MPLPPVREDSFDKVNFVIDSWTSHCDAPWYVYVETMKPAALNAFFTLLAFGFDDVLRGYFRPRGLYKRRTGKRKGKWAKHIPRFPELGEMLGKQLPELDDVRGTKWSQLGKTLWRVDGAMQAAYFFWLVASVTEDFAFEWTSLLYESYWCQDDAPGRFSYRYDGIQQHSGGTWWTMPYPTEDYEYAPPQWVYHSGGTGANPATVTGTMIFEELVGQTPPTEVAIRIQNMNTNTTIAQTGPSDVDPTQITPAVVSAAVPPWTTFRVQGWHNGAWARMGNGIVMGREIVSE